MTTTIKVERGKSKKTKKATEMRPGAGSTVVGDRQTGGWSNAACSDHTGSAGQEQGPNTETKCDFLRIGGGLCPCHYLSE